MKLNFGGEVDFICLDRNTKYCLVDTMVLLPLSYGDMDVTRDVRRGLNGATLVILTKVAGEASYKYKEIECIGETYYGDFISHLSNQLKSAKIAFQFAWFGDEMLNFWNAMVNEKTHMNLSGVDYALLCAAMKRPDMDVLTDDRGLEGSINQERGAKGIGRIRQGAINYNKRRNAVVWRIRLLLAAHISKNAHIKWHDLGRRTVFLVENKAVISVNHSKKAGVQVDLKPWIHNKMRRESVQRQVAANIGDLFHKWRPSKKAAVNGKRWYQRQRYGDVAP